MKLKIFISLTLISLLAVLIAGIFSIRQQGAELIREADRFNVPVIKEVMSKLSLWDYESVKPYLNKKFIKSLSQEEFQKELDNLSILGKVKKIKHIRHVSHSRYDPWLFSSCAINKYSVSTDFEKDSGVVIFKINQCYEKITITFFQVHSKLLDRNRLRKSS